MRGARGDNHADGKGILSDRLTESKYRSCYVTVPSVVGLAGGNASSPTRLGWFIINIDSKSKSPSGVSSLRPLSTGYTEQKGPEQMQWE